MRIVCQQTILIKYHAFMKYHALFVIYEKTAQFEIVVCCKLHVGLYGLTQPLLATRMLTWRYEVCLSCEKLL